MTAEEPKRLASESLHWYDKAGNPCYDQPNKSNGGMRPTTLRDARKLGLVPSVSMILGIINKPMLSGWVKEQVAKAAWLINGENVSEEVFIADTLAKAEEQMTSARDLGTEIHGAIERYLGGNMVPDDVQDAYFPHVQAAVAALKEFGVWGQPFRAEKSFASPLGYGGKVDLSGVESTWVVDFKTVDNLGKRLDYPDRCQQLCAYGKGFYLGQLKDFRLANIFISTTEPGKYLIREWTQEEKERGWEVFMKALDLWRAINNYYP